MAEEQKEENPINIIEGLLFDNKKKIKNGDYVTLMNTLKKLKEKKDDEEGWRMHKITYFKLCEMNDDDGDIKYYYIPKSVLALINTNEANYEKEINEWAIGCGFEISNKTSRWERYGRCLGGGHKWVGKTKMCLFDRDTEEVRQQNTYIQKRIIIKIELFNQ